MTQESSCQEVAQVPLMALIPYFHHLSEMMIISVQAFYQDALIPHKELDLSRLKPLRFSFLALHYC